MTRARNRRLGSPARLLVAGTLLFGAPAASGQPGEPPRANEPLPNQAEPASQNGTAAVRSEIGTAPDEAADREARALFERGNLHLERATRARGQRREGLLRQALDLYTRCLDLVRSRYALFNLALVLEQLGNDREAFAYYTEYLAFEELTQQERMEATGRRDSLLPRLAVVAVESSPPGAEVHIDTTGGDPIGTAPLLAAVAEGEHRVFVRREGYRDFEAPVVVRTGEKTPVTAVLDPLEPPEPEEPEPEVIPPPAGSIAVRSRPPAEVFVDGIRRDRGRSVRVELEPGAHLLRLEAPGHEPAESGVTVEQGQTRKLLAELAPSRRGERRLGAWPLVAWIAAGASGATWIALGGWALSLNAEYADTPRKDLTRDDLEAVEDANLAADVALGATALLGAAALTLTVLDGPVEQEKSRITLDLAGGDHRFVLSARGGFGGP